MVKAQTKTYHRIRLSRLIGPYTDYLTVCDKWTAFPADGEAVTVEDLLDFRWKYSPCTFGIRHSPMVQNNEKVLPRIALIVRWNFDIVMELDELRSKVD